MTQAVKHVYVSKAQSKLVLSSLAFSRCSFSKTERNGTRQDSSGGVEKRVGSGRVGSGRVGSGRVGWKPFFTRPDPSLTLFSLRRDYRAVNLPYTSFYKLNAPKRLWCRKAINKSCDADFKWIQQMRQNECKPLSYL